MCPGPGAQRESRYLPEETRSATPPRWREKRTAGSSRLGPQPEGILFGAQEAVAAGDLFGERRNQAFAIDGDVESGLDAGEEVGDVQGRAGLFKYVVGHVYLRQTFRGARPGGDSGTPAKLAG